MDGYCNHCNSCIVIANPEEPLLVMQGYRLTILWICRQLFSFKNKNLKELVILRLTHIIAFAFELGLLGIRLLILFLHWR